MPLSELDQHIIRTLSYYEIFDHPLTGEELFLFLSKNSLTVESLKEALVLLVRRGIVSNEGELYWLSKAGGKNATLRHEREQLAQKRLRVAKFASDVIRRFPFVRGIFISGDLSKGVALPESDIDYVIITEPNRLWICRSFLVAFKKTFLLNRKKYFCLNYYLSTDNLTLDERNYYTATEIAHVKPLHNPELHRQYLEANRWIKDYFPNYAFPSYDRPLTTQRTGILQKIVESVFHGAWADTLDVWLMHTMQNVWKKRYPYYGDSVREKIFRCSRSESRAYIGNFADKILIRYQEKLEQYNIRST